MGSSCSTRKDEDDQAEEVEFHSIAEPSVAAAALIVTLKKETAEQKATIALLESKLAAKDAGIVLLYDGK